MKFTLQSRLILPRFIWHRTNVLTGESEVEIIWKIPDNSEGEYRVRHFGDHKVIFTGDIVPYSGTCGPFEVDRSIKDLLCHSYRVVWFASSFCFTQVHAMSSPREVPAQGFDYGHHERPSFFTRLWRHLTKSRIGWDSFLFSQNEKTTCLCSNLHSQSPTQSSHRVFSKIQDEVLRKFAYEHLCSFFL